MNQKELLTLRLGIHGEGVARDGEGSGYTIFIEGALPGERVLAELIEAKKTYATARLLQVLTPSSERVAPPCPHFGACGGCQLMHLAPEAQLREKRQRVVDALERIGKLKGASVLPCRPSPEPLGYRNKIQLPVGEAGELGLYARGTHQVIPVERCLIHHPLGEAVCQRLRELLREQPLLPDELRAVLVKTAVRSGQVLVVLVTWQEELSAALSEAAERLMEVEGVLGVVQSVNASPGNRLVGDSFQVLAGQATLTEEICGLSIQFSPASFAQVNSAQAEQLYEAALLACQLTGKERVLDAYCGVGALTLLLARHAREVIGVECCPVAIEDARRNAAANDVANVEFVCGRAEDEVGGQGSFDVVLLNPPRKGCEPRLLEELARCRCLRIVYISCDPASLARDLAHLDRLGFDLVEVEPFDMFPQTAHVESLAILQSRS